MGAPDVASKRVGAEGVVWKGKGRKKKKEGGTHFSRVRPIDPPAEHQGPLHALQGIQVAISCAEGLGGLLQTPQGHSLYQGSLHKGEGMTKDKNYYYFKA